MVDSALLRPLQHTVLVVDDLAENRMLVRAYLDAAYRVLEAEDGPSALRILAEERVDLVLLDVMMPGVSGYDVCKTIKAAPRVPFLPVILLTALSEQEQRNAGLQAGADDFLSKPVDRRELLLRVRAFLKLREQEDQLIKLQALKEDLFSLVLHDVRNPLAGVLGFLNLHREILAEKGPVPEEVKLALAAATRLRELLEDVLEVRLLEGTDLRIQAKPASLRVLAADAALTAAGAARLKRVRIETAGAGDPICVVDKRLVQRALENLLINAVKYTPSDSSVRLTVLREGRQASFEVADMGPGIPDAHKHTLFEKYGSVEAQKGAERRGFGLGLHLVKLVAAAHGGSVGVRDREGGGTVFSIVLPQPESAAAAASSAPWSETGAMAASGGPPAAQSPPGGATSDASPQHIRGAAKAS